MSKLSFGGVLAALSIAATAATAQVVQDAVPAMSNGTASQSGYQGPVGPGDFFVATSNTANDPRMLPLSESALMQPVNGGSFGDLRTSIVPLGGDGTIQYIDQPYGCDNGFYSNNNHNGNPYLTFDDFVADGSPLRNVRFYGGTTNDLFTDVNYIGIEIWSITSGGECGWTYDSYLGGQVYSLAELSPSYVCDVVGAYPSYEMTATFASPISLNAGQNYMILVYANLNDPDGPLYFWNESTVANYNVSTSWDRTDGSYDRCGPDVAFTTNVGGACQDNDCTTSVYYSNFPQNSNSPYISLDDFTATATEDLRHLRFSGGAWNIATNTPADLGNQAGFYIELYESVEDASYNCGNWVGTFLGAYQVSMADANPKFQCVDLHGITEYEFNIAIPAGTYPLTAGSRYTLGVYGVSADSNDPRIFCWGTTDAVYGFNSWSFNSDTGEQEVCHGTDNAFCVNPPAPCLGDYNNDGVVNTLDVLAYLNDWAAGSFAADCNGDGTINTVDVLCFLNRWAAGC